MRPRLRGDGAIARKLGVDPMLAILTAGGTGICGAAAVMGLAGSITVKNELFSLFSSILFSAMIQKVFYFTVTVHSYPSEFRFRACTKI